MFTAVPPSESIATTSTQSNASVTPTHIDPAMITQSIGSGYGITVPGLDNTPVSIAPQTVMHGHTVGTAMDVDNTTSILEQVRITDPPLHNGGGAMPSYANANANANANNDDQSSHLDDFYDQRSQVEDYKSSHKLVKIPEWKTKLFTNGDDIDTHLYNFKNQLERIPGLTNEQISHYLLDSLSPDIKVVAQSMHKDIGMPSYSSMVTLLKKAYPKSRTLIYENFEDQIGCLKQASHQTLSSYIADVQNILNKFKQSEVIFDRKRYDKLEEMAFHALSLRLNSSDQKRLDEQKKLWLEKGNHNPMLLKGRFDVLLVRLVQMSQEDGNNKPSSSKDNSSKEDNSSKKVKINCRFGNNCNRSNCTFLHNKENDKENKPNKKNNNKKKGGVSKKELCGFCKKPGHKEDTCFTKLNKEKKEKENK
jgi:uncharacterized short protein YbdD (DUF466 family)